MKDNDKTLQPDISQQRAIQVQTGCHLVLAPPGCGKTQILTERIKEAHRRGVEYADMLCLTFTNRAARGMVERIKSNIQDNDAERVYVGNVHRFCSKFLFENNVIPAESSVIDDDDAISILARYLDEDEYKVAEDFKRKKIYAEIIFLSHLITQIAHGHPKALRLHPDCLHDEDVAALKKICDVQRMEFNPNTLLDIYDRVELYEDMSRNDAYDYADQCLVMATLRKLKLAKHYEDYKRTNKLVDFEDLLIMAYDVLTDDEWGGGYKRYPWIQVDEVQDLNPLQLAIIDAVTAKKDATVMFLGDEQQAIFSFMGAKLSTLDLLRKRCGDNVHHLSVNHRSPKYLLDVFNEYAVKVLGIDPGLLPQADNQDMGTGDELRILHSDVVDTEYRDVARFAGSLYQSHPDETTAIVVNANRDADNVSSALFSEGLSHFKVSGQDLFATLEVKLLLAHLNVLSNEHNFIAWARLLKGIHVFETNIASRNFVQSLFRCGMLPSDLLSDNRSTYIQDFKAAFESREIVVFDTETTGLDVFEDDIVQIAAVKVRQGRVVPDSHFNVFIATDRPIPRLLGDMENPLLEEMKHHSLLSHDEALRAFIAYVGDSELLGHNAAYDYNILDHNLRRYCPELSLQDLYPRYFDSLKLIRLIEPNLKQYKLNALLEVLHLEGENSHLADEDVNATVSLMNYCYSKTSDIVVSQQQFLARQRVEECANIFRRKYMECFREAKSRLYLRIPVGQEAALIGEFDRFYALSVEEKWIAPIDNIGYIRNYLSADMLDATVAASLNEQLSKHILEINTLKEADLCGSDVINERIYVTTIHKAKGLEFDNVIIFDAIEGRFPNFFNKNNPRLDNEDARKFYVAMTRAKKRLFVSQCISKVNYRGETYPCEITRFMKPIMRFFRR